MTSPLSTPKKPELWTKAWDSAADLVIVVSEKEGDSVRRAGERGAPARTGEDQIVDNVTTRKFFVRRVILSLVSPVIADLPDDEEDAEFNLIGYTSKQVDQFLRIVYPNIACAITPKIIISTARLCNFLGAEVMLDNYVLYITTEKFDYGEYDKYDSGSIIGRAALELEKTRMTAEPPKWPEPILHAMLQEIVTFNNMKGYTKLSRNCPWKCMEIDKTILATLHLNTLAALMKKLARLCSQEPQSDYIGNARDHLKSTPK